MIGGLLGSGTGIGLGAALVVSQKGRTFTPGEVSIGRGESVQILNDDRDLRHHVYLDADKFNFDSGDQEPGAQVNIRFPVVGTFDVLCAIHPKMKLIVKVR
jgi:plastocyanin